MMATLEYTLEVNRLSSNVCKFNFNTLHDGRLLTLLCLLQTNTVLHTTLFHHKCGSKENIAYIIKRKLNKFNKEYRML